MRVVKLELEIYRSNVPALAAPVKIRHKSIVSCRAIATTAFFLQAAFGVVL